MPQNVCDLIFKLVLADIYYSIPSLTKYEIGKLVMPDMVNKKNRTFPNLRIIPRSFLLGICCFGLGGIMPLFAQEVSPDQPAADMQFNVLKVTTSSGSKLAGQPDSILQPLPVAAQEPVGTSSLPDAQPPTEPAVQPSQDISDQTANETSPGDINQPPQDYEKDYSSKPKETNDPALQPMFASLNKWHEKTLNTYTFNLEALIDPFMPIPSVRGTTAKKPGQIDDDSTLSALERYELNQLNLVAIIKSSTPGASLASVEDGAGISYIIHEGDKIGRRGGRVAKIEQTKIIIEQPAVAGKSEPVVMELNPIDSSSSYGSFSSAN